MMAITLLALTVLFVGVSGAEEESVDQQISEALMPLPEDLRAGATVIGYNTDGEELVLRRGSTNLTCTADSPATGYLVACFPNAIAEFRARSNELLAAETPEHEYRDIVAAEIEAGELRLPDRSTVHFIFGGNLDDAIHLVVIYLPGATAESTGLSTLQNDHRPWLMFPGSPSAHVMIPEN